METDLGAQRRLTFDVRDAGGTLVNPATAVLVVTRPDGTTTPSITVTLPPAQTGKLIYDLTPSQAGLHTVSWTTTGPVTAGADAFNVRAASPGYILSLGSLKEHLNIPAATTQFDEELQSWSETVTRLVEDKVGEITRKTYTERHRGGPSIWVRNPPIISVTSVGPYGGSGGSTYGPADVVFTEGGRIELVGSGGFGGGPWSVVYVAGRIVPAPNQRDAAKIILKHMWETQRGASRLPLQGGNDVTVVPGYSFAVPNRALELLAPDALRMNLA